VVSSLVWAFHTKLTRLPEYGRVVLNDTDIVVIGAQR